MFLEDCDNFKDYLQEIFDMYSKESLTKEKALELLKIEYAFEQGKVKENYHKMYPDKRHLEYKFDEFVDSLKKYFFAENFDSVAFSFEWNQWKENFFHHCLKNQTDETNSTDIEKILRQQIDEEMTNVWRLLYLDSDKNQTLPKIIRSYSNTSSLQNKQQHTDEIHQTPEQAQQQVKQEKQKILTLLIKKQLIERVNIKDKPEYRLTETATIPNIFDTLMVEIKDGSIKIDEPDIYKFLKTLKDKNGRSTKAAVNTLKSRNKKNQRNHQESNTL